MLVGRDQLLAVAAAQHLALENQQQGTGLEAAVAFSGLENFQSVDQFPQGKRVDQINVGSDIPGGKSVRVADQLCARVRKIYVEGAPDPGA